eukprot:c23624_g1_i1.p1 GENE.c23624_g1_i1~~c23624_g1_i1.p1  ORF type:complete len:103 (+),score=9.99 c23624_g1_i1:46-309(+)
MASVRSLYRQTLRLAKTYPSKKRAGIIENIKCEYRDYMHERDAEKVSQAIKRAEIGLEQLQMFSKMVSTSPTWTANWGHGPSAKTPS